MPQVTLADIQRMKNEGKKGVLWVTYSYELTRIVERAEPDMYLVGDSGSGWLLGHPEANDTSVEDMISMGRAVKRASDRAPVIVDMPFMSYQVGIEDAIRNAGRIMKETRCDAVKIEGDITFAPVVQALTRVGIPVMAHTGLTPQTTAAIGGMRGGATLPDEKCWEDVRALQEAGAFSIVLTGIRTELTDDITRELRIPTIAGYKASQDCDFLLGWPATVGLNVANIDNPANARYGSLGQLFYDGAQRYIADVRSSPRKNVAGVAPSTAAR